MITVELFALAKLFIPNEVSWWYITIFIVADALLWNAFRGVVQ